MADDNSKIEDERTLAKIIAEKGVLSIKDAVAVTLQLVKVVDDLHTGGKVHRRICADTVHLNEGMSATLDPVETEVTIGGIGINSLPYPPQLQNVPPVSLPEEIKTAHQVLTEAGILLEPCQIDFYQLGALLCFMVSGHNVSDYLRSCKAKASVPDEIRPIIDRALGLNSKNCFSSSIAFAAALQAVIDGKTAQKSDLVRLPDSIFVEPLAKPKTESHIPGDAGAVVEGELPFKKLGHYQIIERIGYGGMGDVYKGYEKALDRFVAIKVLPAELARQKDFIKRFHAEATAIAKLDHPNIVRIYYSGQDHGHHFFAMQYVDGESLADLLTRRKKLSATEAMPIIEQCLAGIGAAHKRGLIHRDIKPGNVLLDSHSRRALVTDFGVVKSTHAGTQITVTGTIMGTVDYIAPEQARGLEVDHRADLYAMGILMYQMLSGQLPFDAKSATSMMFQHAYEPPPPLSEVAPDVPKKLADIVMRLMAKDARDRFQSADDVLTALQNIDLEGAKAASTSQTGIIEAPIFYNTPELPANLSKLTGKNLFGRLRNWITDFFGTHAPQVIEYMQTTSQQVDGAVAEYQRQRDKLAELAKEAKSTAEDFECQAKASRRAAQVAGERAEVAKSTIAKQQALKEKQENEQTAAELAQLAAEQAEQAEEISLRLAKLNAKLAQLCFQRDVLNARMNVAQAHMGKGQILAKRKRRREIAYAVFVILLLSFSVTLIYMLVRGKAESPVGKWESVDFVRETEYFKPGEKQWTGDLYLKGLTFYKDGKTSGPWTWEKGWLWHPGDKTKARYVIKQIDGSSYLFMEWMSGDVTIRGQKPSYYVMKKVTSPPSHTPIIGLPVVFADNLPVDGIVIRESHCTVDFVESLLGAPKRKDGNMLRYTDDSLDFCFSGNGPLSEIHLNNGFKGRLDTGISLASTQQEVFNIYGKPVEIIEVTNLHRKNDEHILYTRANTSRIYYGSHGLIFWFKGNAVNQIVMFKGRMRSSGISEILPIPIAHWKFDEGSGNIAYDSIGKNHGTIYGATWTTGQVGGALSFDGIDDFVETSLRINQNGSFAYTFSALVCPYSSDRRRRQVLCTDNGHYDWSLLTRNGSWSVFTGGGSWATFPAEIGEFQHIVVIFKPGYGVTFYKDGKSMTTKELVTSIYYHPLRIGESPGDVKEPFGGIIDEIRIYNKALSAKEVQQLYRSQGSTGPFGSNIIVPGSGIGQFRLGISKDDLLKRLGKPNVIFHRGEKYTLDNLPKEYFMVYDDISFGIVDDSVEGVSALSTRYKFANGLGIGDSEQKIKQAFGNDYHFKETEGKDFLTYNNKGVQFEIHKNNRTVMELSVFRKER